MADVTKIKYGTGRHQVGVVREPTAAPVTGAAPTPMVVLVHGGSWRWPYNRWLMLLLERDLGRRGWATMNIGYRRLGRFGGGGGWPATFDDVRDAVDAVSVHESTAASSRPVVVVGHSAGGHLALVAAATAENRPSLVVAMSAPTNLEKLWTNGSQPVDELTRDAPHTSRWALTSPLHMLPIGVPVVCVHGGDDTTVNPTSSTTFAAAATVAGDAAQVFIVDGNTHRDALLPSSALWQRTVAAIADHLQINIQV